MAIAVDTGGTGSIATTGSSVSVTVNSNTDGILCVWLMNVATTTDAITNITYNGTSFVSNKLTKVNAAYGGILCMYYLLAPSTGTHNLTLTFTGSQSYKLAWENYTGVSQSVPIDAHNEQSAGPITGGTGIPDTTVTPVSANCWAVSGINSSPTTTAGTGTTARQNNGNGDALLGDSNGTVSSGSAYHLQWNSPASAGVYWTSIDIALAPVAASGPANVKTKDGVTQSTGIKTYEGVALASVKSVEGVS